VKPAVKALLASDAVQRAPTVVRDWLLALLMRGGRVGHVTQDPRQTAPRKGVVDNHS
jgi:hypothetical protein